jgi:hypothetical protein
LAAEIWQLRTTDSVAFADNSSTDVSSAAKIGENVTLKLVSSYNSSAWF